ncbi:Rv3235 family protein [Mycobacterium sp. E740]|uniref:Rv3235 family protein n=1 Tax=Mycobacterium sp. E740 TaxID=1834149 RepID=UPI003518612C
MPVIDCEPAPVGVAACPPPTPKSLRRRPSGGLRTGHPPRAVPAVAEPAPSRSAVVFAEAALRRVLEVIDRRRPLAQLRPVMAPALTDTVLAMARCPHSAAATLRRVRLRMVDDQMPAAEVFGTYSRGPRIRAIAARIAFEGDRWRIVALQIG